MRFVVTAAGPLLSPAPLLSVVDNRPSLVVEHKIAVPGNARSVLNLLEFKFGPAVDDL